MQPIEAFMREFFEARSALLELQVDARAPFRGKFYTPNCLFDSRQGIVKDSRAETVESVQGHLEGVLVVTTKGDRSSRQRYQLRPSGESWLIEAVELWCCRCEGGLALVRCPTCGGRGWITPSDEVAGKILNRLHEEARPPAATRTPPPDSGRAGMGPRGPRL